uniref:Secreted protein n=1 Tax=Culex quinquefasciatus TaxID=7176 RepID=A0A904MX20_CULQU
MISERLVFIIFNLCLISILSTCNGFPQELPDASQSYLTISQILKNQLIKNEFFDQIGVFSKVLCIDVENCYSSKNSYYSRLSGRHYRGKIHFLQFRRETTHFSCHS